MVQLVNATISGEGQNAFFREQIVEFVLAQLYVEPRAAADVIDPRHGRFKVEGACRIGGGQYVERKILFQRAAGVEIQAAEIEAGRSNLLLASRALVGRDQVSAHPVPDRRDAESDWPVARVLPDRGVAIIHELIAVVFEFLAEEIQHRPTFMTSGATQAIFSGEGRYGARRLTGAQEQKD